MCSRETPSKDPLFSPTLSVLNPLFTANQHLRTTLELSTTRLRALAATLATPDTPAAIEAACIEALAIARTALASIERYRAFYAPLFDAEDPIAVLRQAGVVFKGDPGEGDAGVYGGVEVVVQDVGATKRTLAAMVRMVQWYEGRIGEFETWFRDSLRWIEGTGEVERERDEIVLAGREERGVVGMADIEEMLERDDGVVGSEDGGGEYGWMDDLDE